MSNERHERWVQVSPGTVIPAGQPYRIEWANDGVLYEERSERATESVRRSDHTVRETPHEWFVDSSWRPPLVLPTEPTWGIAVFAGPEHVVGQWRGRVEGSPVILRKDAFGCFNDFGIPLDFIPLTDEQVKRIEAAR